MNEADLPVALDRVDFARRVCNRHRGLGGDGLMSFTPLDDDGAAASVRMSLLNADGSYSELSGNGVRCLAAWLASERGLTRGDFVHVHTDVGVKRLQLLDISGARFTFCAYMGEPEAIDRVRIHVAGEEVEAVTLRVGNPQCVVIGELSEQRLHGLAAALSVHPHFAAGANVELAKVES